MLGYNLFCTLTLVVGQYFRYDLYLEWFIARGLLTEYDNLISSHWYKDLIVEQLLMLLSPYPYLDKYMYYEWNDAYQVSFAYRVNDMLLCLSFVRLYILIRFILVAS